MFSFIKRQYLSQIKIQIVKQIGCVDASLEYGSSKLIAGDGKARKKLDEGIHSIKDEKARL